MTIEHWLWLPFFTGLPLALTLPWLGHYQRLRDEWLAALGLTHLSALGALLAALLGIFPFLGALALALGGATAKHFLVRQGNSGYGVMLLFAWSVMLLLAANGRQGEALAQALVDGQLYFAGRFELSAVLAVTACIVAVLPRLANRLLAARFFPQREIANRWPAWRWHWTFEIIGAMAVAIAIATIGAMAAFALLFLPSWAAFAVARNGHAAKRLAIFLAGAAYLIAFAGAYALDQPFGPFFVLILLMLSQASRTLCKRT